MTTYAIYPMGTASFGAATPPSNIAEYLKTPTGTVYIASNTPVVGQVLIATSATNATWQTPSAYTTINDLRIQGNTTNTATAAGTLSIAMGRNTYAGGTNSITLGPNTVSGTSTSVIVGNSCLTVARTAAGDGDSCVIVGSGSTLSNAGGPGSGATFDYNISIGANNQSLYQAGNSQICNNNTLVGPRNTLTLAHNANFRRNFMFTQGHNITTSNAHSAAIQDNIIMGREGSYTSDGTLASNNVVIGTVPRWSGCNNAVIIGPTLNAQLKSGILIGSSTTVPVASGTDAILMGRNITFPGANVAASPIAIGCDIQVRNDIATSPNLIIIGHTALAADNKAMAIGYGASANGPNTICIGNNPSYAFLTGAICIGTNSISSGTGGNTIALGTSCWSRGSSSISIGYTSIADGDDSVCIGRSAIVQPLASQATALGTQAFITNAGVNAVQLGNGTNSTAGSLQFRGFQIHDGTSPAADNVILKVGGTGSYTASAGWNVKPQPGDPTYPGLVAGRSGNPNGTVFGDYDPGFSRDAPDWAFDNSNCPSSCTFAYRDGVNFVRGFPREAVRVHGFDQLWGPNQFWRYSNCRTTTNNRVFVPLVICPPGHMLHMELTVTACRIAGWIPTDPGDPTRGHYDPAYVTGAFFTVDPGKVGGRSWSGVSGFIHYPGGTAHAMQVGNNWGGSKADSDDALNEVSVAGVFIGGFAGALGTIPVVGGAVGAIINTEFEIASFMYSAQTYASRAECSFSRFDCSNGSFGDYEIKGVGFQTMPPTGNKTVGIYVKGKSDHYVEWRVIARCTMSPFAQPGGPVRPYW